MVPMYQNSVKDRPESAGDWSNIPVFGARLESHEWVVRESAYALAIRTDGCLAVVRTSQGIFLPGGGTKSGETPHEAVKREALEECGLVIQPGARIVRAIQFVYSELEQTHFENRSIFLDAVIVGFDSASRIVLGRTRGSASDSFAREPALGGRAMAGRPSIETED